MIKTTSEFVSCFAVTFDKAILPRCIPTTIKMCDANKNPCDIKLNCDKKPACDKAPEPKPACDKPPEPACPPPAPVCEPSPNPKDCEECQATLKAHLKACCDYGVRPKLIEKCSDLEGGCSTPKPTCCPAPPPEPCPCPPVIKCNTPATATFSCPESCPKEEKPACGAKPACDAPKKPCASASPPPAPVKESCAPGGSKATNDCEARPLSMTFEDGSSSCSGKKPSC